MSSFSDPSIQTRQSSRAHDYSSRAQDYHSPKTGVHHPQVETQKADPFIKKSHKIVTKNHIESAERKALKHEYKRKKTIKWAKRKASKEIPVDYIVDHKMSSGMHKPAHANATAEQMLFKLHWKGHDDSEETWEPYASCKELAAMDAYIRDHPELSI